MLHPVAGSLAIALVEGQVSVIQVLSISSDPPQEVEVITFHPAGDFSFLADLKECPPIPIKDILYSLPSNLSYSEGTILELPEEQYSMYLELKEKNQQRLEELYVKAAQDGHFTFARD